MYIYAAVMWIMTIFLAYSDYTIIKKTLEMKKTTDLSEYSVIDYSKSQKITFGIVLVFAISTMIISDVNLEYILINLAILAIAVAELISGIMVMKLYYNSKSIIYEGELIKIKNIKSLKKVKRFGKSFEISTYDGNQYMLNQKLAETIQSLIDQAKEEKVNRKKK